MPNKLHCFLFLLLLVACRKGGIPTENPVVRPVQAVKISALGTLDRYYTGTAEAEEFSILAFKVSGSLTALPVTEGQIVAKGGTIARIDPTDYRLDYRTAEANYTVARSIYERTRRLFEQNATAAQDLEIARADYIRASSALDIARRSLGYTRLEAPFRGIVEKKYVENFQEVLTGDPIVRLVNPEVLNVRFILPETAVRLIDLPKTIYVQFDTRPGHWFEASIKEYVYSSDGSGIPVTLRITDPAFAPYREEVYPGFSAKVLLKIENTISDNYIIPASALLSREGGYRVWVVDPATHTVHLQPVEVLRFEDRALVRSGLGSNDIIVTAGVEDLTDNQKVTLQYTRL